jgi:hypothetical protein
MIHNNYDKLTDRERHFVDNIFKDMFEAAKFLGIKLAGDDRAEYAVEAVATWLLESKEEN